MGNRTRIDLTLFPRNVHRVILVNVCEKYVYNAVMFFSTHLNKISVGWVGPRDKWIYIMYAYIGADVYRVLTPIIRLTTVNLQFKLLSVAGQFRFTKHCSFCIIPLQQNWTSFWTRPQISRAQSNGSTLQRNDCGVFECINDCILTRIVIVSDRRIIHHRL